MKKDKNWFANFVNNTLGKKKVEPEVELTAEEQDMMDEAAAEDQWIEDENGNFIKKDS